MFFKRFEMGNYPQSSISIRLTARILGRRVRAMAEVTVLSEIATSQAVWAIVALILAALLFKKLYNDGATREQRLIDQEKQYRVESKEREKQLMQHLERSNESQEKTAEALTGINTSLSSLEGRVDRIEKHTYQKESA